MEQQIVIGTSGNQPFPIPDPKVSRRHAILAVKANGQYFIIDNGSTNGTFIFNNNEFIRLYPNQPYPVTPDTMIQLGPETRFHVRRLIAQPQQPQGPQKPKPKPQPKKVDISHLRTIAEEYDTQKMSLESRSGMINGLRGCTVLITMLAGTVGTILTNRETGDNKMTSAIICMGIAIILMVTLLYFINVFNKKLLVRRKENEQNYAIKYTCPECHVSFRGKIYENILAERSCPRCKTIYFDKNEKN